MALKVDKGLALSIRQPYAWAIMIGIKKKEYRSRLTNIRGRVYIYAGKQYGDIELYEAAMKKRGVLLADLPLQAIVGTVEIVDCLEEEDGYAWVLKNPEPYKRAKKVLNKAQPVFWKPLF